MMNVAMLLLVALVVAACVTYVLPMLSPLEVVHAEDCQAEEHRVCIRPSETDAELKRLGRGLACEDLFRLPPESRRVFARWREANRLALHGARKPGRERDLVTESREGFKARHAAASPSGQRRLEWECQFPETGEYGVDTSHRAPRAVEVISNYEVCAEAVPGFERDHSGDFRAWKGRNRDGVNAVYWSRSSMRRKQWIAHVRATELRRLQDGSDEDRREQAEWCRSVVVAWLRSGA